MLYRNLVPEEKAFNKQKVQYVFKKFEKQNRL